MFYFRLFEKQRTAYFRVATMMGREAYEIARREKEGDAERMIADYYRNKKQEKPADTEQALNGIPSFAEESEQLLREMQRREFVTRVSQLFLDKNHTTLEEMRKRLDDPELQLGGYHFQQEEVLSAGAKRRKAIAEYLDKHYSFARRLEALDGKPIYTPKKVIVLCDQDTFSAAFHVMAYFKDMGATMVGVAPSQSPNAFMETTNFNLPQSGLRGSISNAVQMFDLENPKADVFHPDFEVTYSTFKKYDFDQETTLRYALDLIAEGKL